jgi:putative peptidoglycan lipid II flippase
MVIPERLMDGLFTRGEFTVVDAQATGALLFHYGWGVPAFVLLRVLQPTFFARGDTRTPMVYSLISVATNIIIGVSLFYTLGFTGLAIGTSAAAWINVAQLMTTIWRRKIYHPSTRAVGKIIRVIASSLALAAILLVIRHFYSPIEDVFRDVAFPGFTAKEITILLVCLVGMGAYPLLLFAFGGVTPAEAKAAMRRKKTDPAPPPATDLQ